MATIIPAKAGLRAQAAAERLPCVEVDVVCPYCGQPNVIVVDESAGAQQSYVEDCQVCCRPWRVAVTLHADDNPEVELRASDA